MGLAGIHHLPNHRIQHLHPLKERAVTEESQPRDNENALLTVEGNNVCIPAHAAYLQLQLLAVSVSYY